MNAEYLRWQPLLADIARAAGQAIMAIYHQHGGPDVQWKADESPLTSADLAANQLICSALVAQTPWPVLSEEAVVDAAERVGWSHFWLVDPLDGTRDFLDRNGEFTVNIALVVHGRPLLGVVYAPALDELYLGLVGQGAWLEQAGRRTPLPARQWAHAYAASRHHDAPATAEFAARNGWSERRAIGSALKFGRLAAGQIDVYPRFGPTCEWDTAAGDAVLHAAGCQLLALPDLTPLRYNGASLRNPHFIALAPHIDPNQLEFPSS